MKAAGKARPQDILAILVDARDTFSKSNRRIADAILSEPHRFVELPIEDLSTWLDLSAPTITRFARTVGCDGLKDLKLKIMGSVRVGIHYLEPATPPGSIEEVTERVSKRAQKTIVDISHAIDLPRAGRIIELINQCQTLYAFGSGGVSSWLVEEIQNRFFRLGIRVIPCADQQMQMMLASTVDKHDLVLCCSLTGESAGLERAIAVAREYGATTVSLAPSASSLSTLVDVMLPVDSPPDDDILSPSSMRYAYLIAIDILAYGVAIARKEAGREKLRRLKQQLATSRDKPDVQPLCD
ncbi:MurR/RpiR family transcriptional regulator [Rhizobium sp. YIM 134829]|uniref:MurR/RpiR family transcriptional regulator n=1 Tax=Rhizobium sp. YIM 134829 TaxID=3390453 RepID=UPI00397D626E